MKRFLVILMVVAMASFLMVGCLPGVAPDPDPDEDVAVTGVTLKATLAFTVGDAPVTLVAIVTPEDATDTSVIWASIDRTVAIVAAGVVTPLNAGISAITATTVDGGFVATCVVTVTAAGEPPEKSEAPIITGVFANDTTFVDVGSYVNIEEATGGICVRGIGIYKSTVKLYINGKLVATTIARSDPKVRSGYGEFVFGIAELGDDEVKTLYATAKEYGLDVSDASDTSVFTLDTVRPELETVSIDGSVFKDGDLILFLDGTSFKEITAEMSEPVSLVPSVDPNYEPVIELSNIAWETGPWATFEISEDGLTLTLTPATAWLAIDSDPFHTVPNFYVYREGKFGYEYDADLVKDAAGNGNVEGVDGDFTLTFVGLSPE
ncbi:Ig domain-containing protein [Candidatus Atribacteria bacterium 1244-E10-H5-B2]|nr:MAG: Ig domain-containing protein [Candidatus Atribacteria bacterium 1244-E10-H5-B2]